MKKAIVLCVLCVFCGEGIAAQQAATPPADAAKPTAPPALKPEVEIGILRLQLEQTQLALRLSQLEAEFLKTSNTFNAKLAETNAATAAALQQSGLDPDKFQLDPGTLKVTAKPDPPKPPPAPVKKSPPDPLPPVPATKPGAHNGPRK